MPDQWIQIPNPSDSNGGWVQIPNPSDVNYNIGFSPSYDQPSISDRFGSIGFDPSYPTGPTKRKNVWDDVPRMYQPEPEPESWAHWLTGQAIENVPAIAGGIAGAYTGPLAPYMVPALGAIGSGIGTAGRQWWEGKGYNPQEIGVSTAFGAIPGVGKLEGTSLRQLGKYALHGAAEGAGQNFLSTFPMHQAQRGNLFDPSKWENPSASEYETNTLMGALFGGATAGVMGKWQQGPSNPYSTLTKIAEAPSTGYRNIPLNQGLNFDPKALTNPNQFDSPKRTLTLQGTADADRVSNAIHSITRSYGAPTFDIDPLAPGADAVRGADIAARATDTIPQGPIGPFDQPDTGMGGMDPLREQGIEPLIRPDEAGGDWSKRPPRQPLRGDEAIPTEAFQPDEGKASEYEWMENFIPKEQGGNGNQVTNPVTREQINQEREYAPDEVMHEIMRNLPDIKDEAAAIYHETNPERISQNFAHYEAERQKVHEVVSAEYDKKNKLSMRGIQYEVPADIQAAHTRAAKLRDLAAAKYERASARLIRGESPGFHQGDETSDSGMYGRDPLRESNTGGQFGHEMGGDRVTGGMFGAPDEDPIRARLRRELGREPTPDEIQSAFNEETGAGRSPVSSTPTEAAINDVLHAFARDPNLKMVDVFRMLRHLPPAEQRRAQSIIIGMINKGATLPDPSVASPDSIIGELTGGRDPLANVPEHDPAWEETPAEALQEPPVNTVNIGGIIDQKKQQLADMGYDPSGMTGWESDMALQRMQRARTVPSGEQPLLGLEEQTTKPGTGQTEFESNRVRQSDVLKVATLHEAGLFDEANRIRQLNEMYGRPISTSEELAALSEHYAKQGDVAKAEQYARQADHWAAKEQGQQELFRPNQIEGGSPNPDPSKMSQQWIDEQNRKDNPPVGPKGDLPGTGMRNPALPGPEFTPEQQATVKRQQDIDEIIRLEDKVRQLDTQAQTEFQAGRPDKAMQYSAAAERHRQMVNTAQIQYAKQWEGHMRAADKYESMARMYAGRGEHEAAARMKKRAEDAMLTEASHLELKFRKNYLAQKMREMGFELDEKTIKAIEDLDPQLLSHSIQKDFAELVFSSVGQGPPGLSVVKADSGFPHLDETHITIRNEQGRPIAHAEIQHNRFTGEGDLVNWAINQDAGMAQKAILPLAMELNKRGALVPKGPYSEDTKNFLQRLVNALKSERGAAPIFTGGRGPVQMPSQMPPGTPGGGGQNAAPGGKRKPRRQKPPPAAGGNWWDRLRDYAGWGQGYKTNKRQRLFAKQQLAMIDQMLAMPNNMTTTGDLSAPGRQGLMQFHTPEFWRALGAMFRGIHPDAFKRIDAELQNMRIMQSQGIDPKTGKQLPSMFQKWGGKYFLPASTPGPHAKGAASNWLETGHFFNKDWGMASRAYAKTPFAMLVRGSNRAFITFLNHLNVNRIQYLADRAQDNSRKALRTGNLRKQGVLGGFNPSEFRFGLGKIMPDIDIGFRDKIDFNTASRGEIKAWNDWAENLDPYRNIALGREITDAVNTLTGHAPLKLQGPVRGMEMNLEKHARLFGRVFFAPGLMFSKFRMMNPFTYAMATPAVRKQYLAGWLGATAGATSAALLLKNGAEALGYDADINLDSNSADFMKVRVGNYRMDPSGGLVPYLVLGSRLMSGYYTSSATGKTTELGEGYQATTAGDLRSRFFANKEEPVWKFAADLMAASQNQPVYMKDRMIQMMVPLLAQDIYELSQEDPGLIPLSVGSFFGAGSQVYQRGVSGTKFTNPENEWTYAGGGVRGMFMGADFQNNPQGGRGSGRPGGGTGRPGIGRPSGSRPLGTARRPGG